MMTICQRYAMDQMEAEDLLMESFVKIYRFIHQYKSEGSFEGWMRRIVVNTALKHIKKKKIRFEEVLPEQMGEAINAGAYIHLEEKEILALVKQLPNGYRIVFNLFAIEGFSHDEIADLLGIGAGTSRSQLAKARKMLQQQIQELHKTVAA